MTSEDDAYGICACGRHEERLLRINVVSKWPRMITALTCTNPMPDELQDIEEKRPEKDTTRKRKSRRDCDAERRMIQPAVEVNDVGHKVKLAASVVIGSSKSGRRHGKANGCDDDEARCAV